MTPYHSQKVRHNNVAISFISGLSCVITLYFVIPTDPLFELITIANVLLIGASLGWAYEWGSTVKETSRLNIPYLSAPPLFLFLALLILRENVLPGVNSASFALVSGVSMSVSIWATLSLDKWSQRKQLLFPTIGKISICVALFCMLQFIFDEVNQNISRAILIGIVTYCLTEVYFLQLNYRSGWRFSGILTGTIATQIALVSYFTSFSNFENGILTFSVVYFLIVFLESFEDEYQQSTALMVQMIGISILLVWSLS